MRISRSSRVATVANLSREGFASIAQVLMVPLFIASFGQFGYVTWITINSYTAFILMSDFGILIVATVFLTNSVRSTDTFAIDIWEKCKALTLKLSITIAFSLFVLYWGINFLFKHNISDAKTSLLVFVFLAILSILTVWQHTILSTFQIFDRYGQGMTLLAVIRIVEVCLVFILLTFKCQIITLSFAYLIIRSFLTFSLWQKQRKLENFSKRKLVRAPEGTFRALLPPSIGVAALNFASMLGIHGSFLVSTLWLKPGDLIAIAIARMISSPLRLMTTALLIGTFPDFISHNSVTLDDVSVVQIERVRSNLRITFITIILTASTTLILVSHFIWNFLSRKSLEFPIWLVTLFIIATILDAVIGFVAQEYISKNLAHKIGYIYLVITLFFLALQRPLGLVYHLQAVPVIIILTDVVILALLPILKSKRKD